MIRLAGAVVKVIVTEYGSSELIRRLADPFWFQAFGAALGFDWHSSGVTTVVTGVLRVAIDPQELGVAVCGGKGSRSTRTPREIEEVCESLSISSRKAEELKRASMLAAKVDNAALQDGFPLYHHVVVFDEDGEWAIIQQGMDVETRLARRYHWLSEGLSSFVVEPHKAVVGARARQPVLNLVARESEDARRVMVDIVGEGVVRLKRLVAEARGFIPLDDWLRTGGRSGVRRVVRYLKMPWSINWRAVERAYQLGPRRFEELLEVRGLGPSTLRGLALISALIFGAEPSWRDPVKFSFAFGGKDGVPFPVNRDAMDEAIQFLWESVRMAEMGERDRLEALKRLSAIRGGGK